MFVPHDVPAVLLPPSMQLIVPLVHAVVPVRQTPGLVLHDEPAVHAPHIPLLQTMFVPHDRPFALLPPSTQVIVPLKQDVVPIRQLLVGYVVHDAPAVHALHAPLLQTMFKPHDVPFALLVPSTQVIVPVEQDVVPFLQLFVGLVVHDEPAVHALHVPLLQTPVPHAVPFATLPVSAQTTTPVTHDVAPVLQRFVGWQPTPPWQMPQVPLLQTMFVPHEVPLARFRPVSAQVIDGEHVCVPAWQGFAGVHASPAVQETQAPELQTMFVPHEVPLATFAASTQTGAPLLHAVVPVRQGLLVTAQIAPSLQSTQAPVALQTLSWAQVVPTATFVPLSVQVGVPVEQASPPV
jgi:hypothetical protein